MTRPGNFKRAAKGVLTFVLLMAAVPAAAQAADNVSAAEEAEVNEQAFIQFALRKAGKQDDIGMSKRAAKARLTGQERRQVAMIRRDAKKAAAEAKKFAKKLPATTAWSTEAAAISEAAVAVETAAAQQNYDALDTGVAELAAAVKAPELTVKSAPELDALALQSLTQTQQQQYALLSNVTKMMHDTAMSVIRKIG